MAEILVSYVLHGTGGDALLYSFIFIQVTVVEKYSFRSIY